jgi:hypothetical protein
MPQGPRTFEDIKDVLQNNSRVGVEIATEIFVRMLRTQLACVTSGIHDKGRYGCARNEQWEILDILCPISTGDMWSAWYGGYSPYKSVHEKYIKELLEEAKLFQKSFSNA